MGDESSRLRTVPPARSVILVVPIHRVTLTYLCYLFLPDFGQAEVQFEKILKVDPYRIDDIDVFSNILYVTDNKLKLSRLAHEFLALDKDRPEVCCLVGSYSSSPQTMVPFKRKSDFAQATTIRYERSMKKLSSILDVRLSLIEHIYRLGR